MATLPPLLLTILFLVTCESMVPKMSETVAKVTEPQKNMTEDSKGCPSLCDKRFLATKDKSQEWSACQRGCRFSLISDLLTSFSIHKSICPGACSKNYNVSAELNSACQLGCLGQKALTEQEKLNEYLHDVSQSIGSKPSERDQKSYDEFRNLHPETYSLNSLQRMLQKMRHDKESTAKTSNITSETEKETHNTTAGNGINDVHNTPTKVDMNDVKPKAKEECYDNSVPNDKPNDKKLPNCPASPWILRFTVIYFLCIFNLLVVLPIAKYKQSQRNLKKEERQSFGQWLGSHLAFYDLYDEAWDDGDGDGYGDNPPSYEEAQKLMTNNNSMRQSKEFQLV